LIAVSLWHAPTYGWMMLVSAWARRAAFLWAILPAVAISFFEKIVFGTNRFADFLKYRFMNWADDAFAFRRNSHGQPLLDSLSQLTPGRYLTTPGLWLGLIFAVVCLAIAIRLRRYRGPI
jgi:ABC-2 type transport system permease protein